MKYLLLFLLFAIPANFSLAADFFTRDLKQGDVGEDVRMLQQILNRSKQTEVSSFGLCSPGQETDLFNILTRIGVVKFQEKYAAEILAPLGLTSGTGYVGPATRRKLNSLIAAESVKTAAPVSIPVSTTATSVVVGPSITKINPSQAINGSTVTIYGQGFTPTGNRVATSFGIFDNIPSVDGQTLVFKFDSEILKSIESIDLEAGDEFDDNPIRVSTKPLPIAIMVSNINGFSQATTSFSVIFQ